MKKAFTPSFHISELSCFQKKSNFKLLMGCAFLVLSLISFSSYSQSGKVFRDFNGNGTQDTYEPLVSGILVKAYNAAGALCSSTTSAGTTAPNYTLPAGCSGQVRVEFEIPLTTTNPCGPVATIDYTAGAGSTYGSSVQFVASGAANVNFAINNPEDYWDNVGQPKPLLMVPCYVNGDITSPNKALPAAVIFANDQNGLTITEQAAAITSSIGSNWGEAFQKSNQRFFLAALLKRHVGLGPQGVGGVYILDASGASYAVSGSFTLQGVVPNNTATPINLGAITRVTSPATADNYLTTAGAANNANRDLDAFGKIGKVCFGDIDFDESTKKLFLVNTFQQSLISVDVSGTTASLNNASAATLKTLTNSYAITSLPGVPTATGGVLRPWALKFYRGKGYLGVIADASTSRSTADLKGYILSFDPANVAAGFQTILSLNFTYRTAFAWNPWTDLYSQTGLPTNTKTGTANQDYTNYGYPQPVIGDIEFDEKGGMTMDIMDRFGHQVGELNYVPVSGSTQQLNTRATGDILYACYNNSTGTWAMEGSTAACKPPNTTANNISTGYTPNVGEWYNDDSGDGSIENGVGALAKLMGSNLVVGTVEDPYPGPLSVAGSTYWNTGGVHWYNNTTGTWTQYARIFSDVSQVNFGKAAGLGDLEYALLPPPIEIGNRVWNDTDKDGIQDAGEAGIANVTIELYADFNNDGVPDGAILASTQTSSTGTWYFNNGNVTDGDPSTAGNQTGLALNKNYLIRVGAADWTGGTGTGDLIGYSLTKLNATSAGLPDVSDNDATLINTIPTIAYTTGTYGQNNHTLDMGFTCSPTIVTATATPATCTGGTANNDAKISLTASSADKFGISAGATYTGGLYAAAIPLSSGSGVTAGLLNPATATQYTIRVFNGSDACFKDTTITLQPTFCCSISLTATPSACVSSTNNYTVSGNLTFSNPPTTGTLTVSVGTITQIFNAPFTSNQAYTLSGLPSDAASHIITAVFSATTSCTNTITYTAPKSCSCPTNNCGTVTVIKN